MYCISHTDFINLSFKPKIQISTNFTFEIHTILKGAAPKLDANVCSSFVLVQLTCSTIIMTISIFYLDLVSKLKKIDWALHWWEHFYSQRWQQFDFIVASAILTTSIGMSTLLWYCYFGKLAAKSYAKMLDCVYNMKWYDQPNESQKYFILMTANMQKTVYYHGSEVAKMDVETFIKVCAIFVNFRHKFVIDWSSRFSFFGNCRKKCAFLRLIANFNVSTFGIDFQFQLFRKVFSFYIAIKTITSN